MQERTKAQITVGLLAFFASVWILLYEFVPYIPSIDNLLICCHSIKNAFVLVPNLPSHSVWSLNKIVCNFLTSSPLEPRFNVGNGTQSVLVVNWLVASISGSVSCVFTPNAIPFSLWRTMILIARHSHQFANYTRLRNVTYEPGARPSRLLPLALSTCGWN